MGEEVILDNGAYEGIRLPDEELLRWVLKLRPTIVVLPDIVGDWRATAEESVKFKRALREVNYLGQTLYVLHTDGKWNTTVLSFKEAILSAADYIGFSRLTPSYSEDVNSTRVSKRALALKELKKTFNDSRKYKFHALGMLNGNCNELQLLRDAGFESIDSSSPVWRGLHGYKLHEPWPGADFDPMRGEDLGTSQMEVNLAKVIDLCK